MVGQDLAALDSCCDWIKVMTYGHTLGPAGLPFELGALAGWLSGCPGIGEGAAMASLAGATRLPLPPTRERLEMEGVPPAALAAEVERARAAGVTTLLAGIELVDAEAITHLSRPQIITDLHAFRSTVPDGLCLSWDLWRIPNERLDLVRLHYCDAEDGQN
jgi:hypothetical protein